MFHFPYNVHMMVFILIKTDGELNIVRNLLVIAVKEDLRHALVIINGLRASIWLKLVDFELPVRNVDL